MFFGFSFFSRTMLAPKIKILSSHWSMECVFTLSKLSIGAVVNKNYASFSCGNRTDFNTDIGAREMQLLSGLVVCTLWRRYSGRARLIQDGDVIQDRDRPEIGLQKILAYNNRTFFWFSFVVCYRWHFRTDWCRFR